VKCYGLYDFFSGFKKEKAERELQEYTYSLDALFVILHISFTFMSIYLLLIQTYCCKDNKQNRHIKYSKKVMLKLFLHLISLIKHCTMQT
jgi:hypothetical protein